MGRIWRIYYLEIILITTKKPKEPVQIQIIPSKLTILISGFPVRKKSDSAIFFATFFICIKSWKFSVKSGFFCTKFYWKLFIGTETMKFHYELLENWANLNFIKSVKNCLSFFYFSLDLENKFYQVSRINPIIFSLFYDSTRLDLDFLTSLTLIGTVLFLIFDKLKN